MSRIVRTGLIGPDERGFNASEIFRPTVRSINTVNALIRVSLVSLIPSTCVTCYYFDFIPNKQHQPQKLIIPTETLITNKDLGRFNNRWNQTSHRCLKSKILLRPLLQFAYFLVDFSFGGKKSIKKCCERGGET